MNKKSLDPKLLLSKASRYAQKFVKYAMPAFLVFVACIYGFILFQINSLVHKEPTADAVSSQVKAAQVPHIDEKVVKQLKSLNDNSVNVQAFFNQARNNPFE